MDDIESFKFLNEILSIHFEKICVILIDERDTPTSKGCRDDDSLEILSATYPLLIQSGLKNNPFIYKKIYHWMLRNFRVKYSKFSQ